MVFIEEKSPEDIDVWSKLGLKETTRNRRIKIRY